MIASSASGFVHPLGGADHFLAMTAVGVWAVLAGGRAIWIWPSAFVATMLAGFAAATFGLQVPLVEPVIASSIVVLGLLIAFTVQAPVWLGAAIVGVFRILSWPRPRDRGHGNEPCSLGAGFALATAALHAAGIWLALFARINFERRLT